MISMLLRARSFDPNDFKVGTRMRFLMADGNNCDWQAIVYRGKKKFKMENSSTPIAASSSLSWRLKRERKRKS